MTSPVLCENVQYVNSSDCPSSFEVRVVFLSLTQVFQHVRNASSGFKV